MIEKQNEEARREKQRRKAQAEVARRSQVRASRCYQRRLGLCEEPCNAPVPNDACEEVVLHCSVSALQILTQKQQPIALSLTRLLRSGGEQQRYGQVALRRHGLRITGGRRRSRRRSRTSVRWRGCRRARSWRRAPGG